MAKTKTCAFCGKDVGGIFSDDREYFNVGLSTITCCKACYKKYKDDLNIHKDRFEAKVTNIKKTTKSKLSHEDIAKMFVTYVNEAEEYNKKSQGKDVDMFHGFFCYDSNANHFVCKEFAKGFINSDVDAKSMIKSMESAQNEIYTEFFDKNDITKIEYARTGIGDPLGLFSIAYSYNIRLNDEKVMTFKPCITRAATLGRGFIFGYKRSSEKQLMKIFAEFKRVTGSDLPVVKVRKI